MAATGFIIDAVLLDHVKGLLTVATLDLDTPWTGIAHFANLAAYGQIRNALLKRGFSIAQVDAWDDGAEYQLDLGTFWALTKGGCTKDYDAKFIASLDRRKELPTVYVTRGGVPVVPATPRVAVGAMGDPLVDIFNLTDRDLWDWQRAALADNNEGRGPQWVGQGTW